MRVILVLALVLLPLFCLSGCEWRTGDFVRDGFKSLEKQGHEAAIKSANRALEMDPKCAEAYYLRMAAQQAEGRCQEAIADANQAFDHFSEKGVAYVLRGTAYLVGGDVARAKADCEQGMKLFNKQAIDTALLRRGVTLAVEDTSNLLQTLQILQGLAHLADDEPDLALECSGTSAGSHALRGAAHLQIAEYKIAIVDCSAAIEQSPDEAAYYYLRGSVYYRLAKFREALADFDVAIGLSKVKQHEYYLARAEVWRAVHEDESATRDVKLAIELVIRAVEKDPSNARTRCALGLALVEAGRHAEAINEFSQVIASGGNSGAINLSLAHYGKGRALFKSGQAESSLAEFTAAIECAPNYKSGIARALMDRGFAKQAMGDFVGSYDDIRAASLADETVLHDASQVELAPKARR